MKTCTHVWGMWIGYDPMVIEFELTNSFSYYRTCQNFGCNAQQKTEHLMEHGKFEQVESTIDMEKEIAKLTQEAKDWDTGVKKPTDPEWFDVDPGSGEPLKKD